MNKRNLLWTIVLLLGWGMSAQAQTHLFATPEGTGAANGLDWENASTLQYALTNANNNTIIHLKVGEYLLTSEIIIPTGVTVIGGYEQSSAGSDITHKLAPGYNSNWINPTMCSILSGDYTHRMATVQGTMESCVVRYGRTTGNGAGVLVDGGIVTHCVLMNNMAYNTAETSQAKGGGAYGSVVESQNVHVSGPAVMLVDGIFQQVVLVMHGQQLHQRLQRVGTQVVVAVDKGDVFALGACKTGVARSTQSAIFATVSDHDTCILGGELVA